MSETITRYYGIGPVTETDFGYTGQRDLGNSTELMDYNARFYGPVLGRFTQADTVVVSIGNPQSLNRYSYVNNNPLKFTDPTGHFFEVEAVGGGVIGPLCLYTPQGCGPPDSTGPSNEPVKTKPPKKDKNRPPENTGHEDDFEIDPFALAWAISSVTNYSTQGLYTLGVQLTYDLVPGSTDAILSYLISEDGYILAHFWNPDPREGVNRTSEQSLLSHYEEHGGPWNSPAEYT